MKLKLAVLIKALLFPHDNILKIPEAGTNKKIRIRLQSPDVAHNSKRGFIRIL